MSNPKPDFPIVIKTSIQSITKHPRNISPNSKRSTNQGKITFKPNISKPHFLSFLHSMYNSIKLSNHISMNFKKRKESTNKLPHTPTKNTSTSSFLTGWVACRLTRTTASGSAYLHLRIELPLLKNFSPAKTKGHPGGRLHSDAQVSIGAKRQ